MSDRGILWVATGDKFRAEASQSISRVASLVDERLAVATDEPEYFENSPIDKTFNIDEPKYSWADKVEWFAKSPFKRTLYLDTDTYLLDPNAPNDLFSALEGVDIAAAHDTHKDATDHYQQTPRNELPEVSAPRTFPWLNTGVVAFRDNNRTHKVFEKWKKLQNDFETVKPGITDQAAFRESLFTTDVQVGTFSSEYNFRVPFYQHITSDVKIIHGRSGRNPELAKEVNRMNSPWSPRIFHYVGISGKWYPIKMEARNIQIIYKYLNGWIRSRIPLSLKN